MMAKQDRQTPTRAETFFGAGLIILGISGVLLADVIKDYQDQIEMEEVFQAEPEPGYYKVHFLQDGEDELVALITNANGDIELFKIPIGSIVGRDRDSSILKVYINGEVKLYNFISAIE